MKNTTLLLALLLLGAFGYTNQAFSQSMPSRTGPAGEEASSRKPARANWLDNLFVEGNFGMSFSSNYTQVEISPVIGYNLNQRVSLAAGPIYEFLSYKPYYNSDEKVKINLAGARTFGRFYIFDELFAHAEYDYLRYKDNLGNKTAASRLPLGAGYRSGGRVSMVAMALYDVLYQANKDKPAYQMFNDFTYGGWIIRFGVNFSL